MSWYLDRLEGANETLPFVGTRVALLTGQSSFVSSALSPVQVSFLRAVAPVGASVLEMGFPFDSSFLGEGFQEAGMAGASWRNARQVGWALGSERFRGIVRARLGMLFGAASRTILITGSCGLQLANVGWPGEVIALGPACLGPLRVRAYVIRGRGDGWSRLFYRGRVDRACGCGHLGYWESEEVREIVRGILR